jgi:transcriptional regulator with XRE-family HTH domain
MIEEKTFRQSYRASIVYPEIEKWMMTHQLRIKDFAELIDVSYNHTACILHGYHEPRLRIIRKILNVTGLTFTEAFCTTMPLKKQRRDYYASRNRTYTREWEAYWPNLETLFKEKKIRLIDLANEFDTYGKGVRLMVTAKNGKEPDMSLYYVKRFLEITGDTFEHLFALPESERM